MKIRYSTGLGATIAAAIALGVIATAWAAPQQHAPVTKSLQEHPLSAEDTRLRALYEVLADARTKGADKVDAGLEKKLREMARNHPVSHGLDARAWEDHVVDMGGQMLRIGSQDPKVFQSYENFVVALRGPQ